MVRTKKIEKKPSRKKKEKQKNFKKRESLVDLIRFVVEEKDDRDTEKAKKKKAKRLNFKLDILTQGLFFFTTRIFPSIFPSRTKSFPQLP
jgi:hypothetical protein